MRIKNNRLTYVCIAIILFSLLGNNILKAQQSNGVWQYNAALEGDNCSSYIKILDEYDESLRVNASALFKITSLFAKEMKINKQGSIINIGSIFGLISPDFNNYKKNHSSI